MPCRLTWWIPVDYAVINSNYAIEAGLNPMEDALTMEGASLTLKSQERKHFLWVPTHGEDAESLGKPRSWWIMGSWLTRMKNLP